MNKTIARLFRWLLGPCERPCCAHGQSVEALDTTRLITTRDVFNPHKG